MLLSAIFSNFFSKALSENQFGLKFLGSIYIIYFVFSVFKSKEKMEGSKFNSFLGGFLFQFLIRRLLFMV